MKTKKDPIFAAVMNFFFWGIGYIYLEKRTIEAFYLTASYFLVWIFSFAYLTISGPVIFTGVYWIIFWSLWVSMYISYDAYRLARVKKK